MISVRHPSEYGKDMGETLANLMIVVGALIVLIGGLLSSFLWWIGSEVRAQWKSTEEQGRELRSEIGKLRSEMKSQGKELRSEMKEGFESQRAATDRRFDEADRRFDAIDRRFDRVDSKFTAAGKVSSKQGERIARLEAELRIPPPEADEAEAA